MNVPTDLDGAGLRGALLTANEYVQNYRWGKIWTTPFWEGTEGLARTENLSVDAFMCHTPTAESVGEVGKERGRPAQIKVGFEGYAQLFEDGYGQVAGPIEIETQSVGRVGPAVAHVAPRVR